MKKIIVLALLAGSLTACQSTGGAPSDPSAYLGKTSSFQKKYMACLISEGLIAHGKAQSEKINRSSVIAKCKASRNEYHKAIYANSFIGRSDAQPSWKQRTAVNGIKEIDGLVFTKLATAWKQQANRG